MHRLILPLALAGVALGAPGAATAAENVGVDPQAVWGSTPQTCPSGCTIVQDANANAAVRIPTLAGGRGVITSWRIRGSGGSARLRSVAVSGGSVAARGATAWSQLADTDATQSFVARLPVSSGDAIGVDLGAGATIVGEVSAFGDIALAFRPALGDAETSRPDEQIDGYVAYQAVVEPDADGDGLGDETQDACVACDSHSPPPPASDPYAAIRTSGPSIGLPASGALAKRAVVVTVTNPYAFAIEGKLTLKRGRKVVGRARVKLAATGTRTLRVKISRALARKNTLKLTATAVMKGPVGKARTTQHKLTAGRPARGGGVDGKYGGKGVSAGWTMVIGHGVVQNFNGTMTLYCTKQKQQETVTFAMVGSDPKPHLAADGTFAWEATKDYGFQKLKFSGRVSGGTVTGKMMVEDRPLIPRIDPVSGMPRIVPEYCFAGAKYTLTRK